MPFAPITADRLLQRAGTGRAEPAGPVQAGAEGHPGSTLTLRQVSLGYRGRPAIVDVSGQFRAGTLTAIIGPNGGGKTTLLKGLLGLLPPLRGAIEPGEGMTAMAYLGQRSEVDPSFPITVSDFVSIGLWSVTGSLRGLTSGQRLAIEAALQGVGLAGLGRRWISDLSGGQFQRMRFARLLVQDAPILLLDEPFAGVDGPTIEALLRIIVAWHVEGRTVIVVLHDLERVRRHFPLTLMLDRRVLAWGETAAVLASPPGPERGDGR